MTCEAGFGYAGKFYFSRFLSTGFLLPPVFQRITSKIGGQNWEDFRFTENNYTSCTRLRPPVQASRYRFPPRGSLTRRLVVLKSCRSGETFALTVIRNLNKFRPVKDETLFLLMRITRHWFLVSRLICRQVFSSRYATNTVAA